MKGCTVEWGIPDPYFTEFDEERRLVADFLYVVYFLGGRAPELRSCVRSPATPSIQSWLPEKGLPHQQEVHEGECECSDTWSRPRNNRSTGAQSYVSSCSKESSKPRSATRKRLVSCFRSWPTIVRLMLQLLSLGLRDMTPTNPVNRQRLSPTRSM